MAEASVGAARSAEEIEPAKLRRVVMASAIGTVFEWYDFFVYGALATVVAAHFFTPLPDAQAFVFTLLTFAVGFIVRPLGALVFGKIGDSKGRKGAFLTTITIMGLATVAIGLLPDYDQIGILAPILLITCRILQGFALGGEYGGAVIYVAEHAPLRKRGLQTGWIQCTAALGLIGALVAVLATRTALGDEAFRDWGWRIPFLISAGLLVISIWIRLSLEESPAFQKIKEEGRQSKAAIAESLFAWRNLKIVLIALFSIMMAQGVVWYTATFYSQFFLEKTLKVDGAIVNELMLVLVTISAPLYVFFAWLSDKIGRKPIMLFGMVVMLIAYFPGFKLLTEAANPALAAANARAPAVVVADPSYCSFQLDLTGGAQSFAKSCDIAKSALAAAGVTYTNAVGEGPQAVVRIGEAEIAAPTAPPGATVSEARAIRKAFEAELRGVLTAAGYPEKADPAAINYPLVFAVLLVFAIAGTSLYGPLAAAMVELFPTRIRYTAMSFPYHVGTGWFGGLLPATVFAIVTATGDIYAGLWFPFIATAIAITLTLVLLPETRHRDIHD